VIGCNANVGCTVLNDGQNGGQYAAYRPNLPAVHIFCGWHGEKMPEQFISPVNQVHIHAAPIIILWVMLYELG
jgi:hypothetical protein